MTSSIRHSARGLAWALLLLLAAAPLRAQPAPAYDEPGQVKALDAVLSQLIPDAANATPDDLVELSRVLAEPCDQMRWLLLRVQAWDAQPGTQAQAKQLAQAALKRAEELSKLELLGSCGGDLQALGDIAKRSEALESITDPSTLATRLAKATGLPELPAPAKFALLSRGASAEKLLGRGTPPDWAKPYTVMNGLAGRDVLPTMGELLRLQQELASANAKWAEASPSEFPDRAYQPLVSASFQIAGAWLDRALGLDQQDCKGLTRPVPYPDSREAWENLAESLEQNALWTWAALAHLLAATPAQADSLGAARRLWDDVRKVNPQLWPAVDDKSSGWLVRGSAADQLVQPRKMPLTPDFRSAARARRQEFEEKIRVLLASGTPDIDELFKNIQWAKAAELGAPITPLTIDDLKHELGETQTQTVYLFLELLELRPTAREPASRLCGVAVYRSLYRAPRKGEEQKDEYLAKPIPPQDTPARVLTVALGAPGPPLRENSQIRKDARIIIALDGPPSENWFSFELDTLLKPTEWSVDPAWLVYLPSAAALKSERWNLDETLRLWYPAVARLWNGRVSAPALLPGAGPPVHGGAMKVDAVTFGGVSTVAQDKLRSFLAAKRDNPTSAIALSVHD